MPPNHCQYTRFGLLFFGPCLEQGIQGYHFSMTTIQFELFCHNSLSLSDEALFRLRVPVLGILVDEIDYHKRWRSCLLGYWRSTVKPSVVSAFVDNYLLLGKLTDGFDCFKSMTHEQVLKPVKGISCLKHPIVLFELCVPLQLGHGWLLGT